MQLKDSYDVIYEEANELVAEGFWEDALEEYERIFNRLSKLSPESRAKHPHLDELFINTSFEFTMLLMRLGEYDQAIEVFDRLVDLVPDRRTQWKREKARQYLLKDEVEEGLRQLEALAEEEPDQPFTELTFVEAYIRSKSYDEAIEHINRAIELADDDEVRNIARGYLFNIYLETDQLQKATEVWKTGVKTDKSLNAILSLLYAAYLEKGDLEGMRALLPEDNNPLSRGFYAGQASYLEGDMAAAEQQWHKVARRDIDEESERIDLWMESTLRVGQAQRVIDLVTPIFSAGKVTLRSVLLYGIAWAMKGDVERVDTFFDAVRENMVWSEDGLLSDESWKLLDSLVQDEEVKAALRHHFFEDDEVISEQEGESTAEIETGEEVPASETESETSAEEPVETETENEE